MFAYLDAGTLSLLGAAFAGGIAGIFMMLRMYGNKVLGVFSKNARRRAEIAEGELLGIEIDPETGKPVDPDAAAQVLGSDDASAPR